MNNSSILYFSKSTSINTQYSSLWGTLEMMLFTKYLIKWKRIGRISWKFRYWFNLKFSVELDTKKIDVILVQCPFKSETILFINFLLLHWNRIVYKYWLLMREIVQNNSPRWLETVGYYISWDKVKGNIGTESPVNEQSIFVLYNA